MTTATTTIIDGKEVRIVLSLENEDKTPYVVQLSQTRTDLSYLLSSELEDLAEEVTQKFGS